MKIARIHSAFDERGGTERNILEETLYLRKNHVVDVYATHINKSKCYPELMEKVNPHSLIGLPKFGLAINTGLNVLLATWYQNFFKKYDVLITHHQPSVWIAYQTGKPYVSYIHSLLTFLYKDVLLEEEWTNEWNRKIIKFMSDHGLNKFLKRIDQLSVGNSNVILVRGKKIAEKVRQIYERKPVIMPYGFDSKAFQPRDYRKLFREWNITKPIILSVGRATQRKGYDTLISIMPKILRRHPKSTLVIASQGGPLLSRLQNMARKLGIERNIRFVKPNNDQLMALYSGATVLGLPSRLEYFGRVPIEGMFFGVPSVVWNDGWGPSENVVDGTGLQAKAFDKDDFLDKLLTLLNDSELRAKLGVQAREYALKTYSWENCLPKLEEVLMKCI